MCVGGGFSQSWSHIYIYTYRGSIEHKYLPHANAFGNNRDYNYNFNFTLTSTSENYIMARLGCYDAETTDTLSSLYMYMCIIY